MTDSLILLTIAVVAFVNFKLITEDPRVESKSQRGFRASLIWLVQACLPIFAGSFVVMIWLFLSEPDVLLHSLPQPDGLNYSFKILFSSAWAGILLSIIVWTVAAAYWYVTKIPMWLVAVILGTPATRLSSLYYLLLTVVLFAAIGAESTNTIEHVCKAFHSADLLHR
jgi:hypothetical protein